MRLLAMTRRWMAVGAVAVCLTGGALWAKGIQDRAETIRKLAQARQSEALRAYNQALSLCRDGEIFFEPVCEWSKHLLDAQLELASTRSERASACKAHLERIQAIKKIVDEKIFEADVGKEWSLSRYNFFLREAELWLTKEE